MENTERKITIELSQWQFEKLNAGLKYLIGKHIENPANFRDIPDGELKAISYLIVWRAQTFDNTRKPAEMASDDEINAKIKSHE